MKCVMLSIRPKYCELIASGKKAVEVRKTKPKIDVPFKCYIYETKDKHFENIGVHYADGSKDFIHHIGKVIGEFVCDKIFTIRYMVGCYRCEGLTPLENDRVASASQLSFHDMRNYLLCNDGYGWHISNLVIYDKPKELREFYQKCKSYDKDEWDIDNLDCIDCENPCGNGGKLYLKRPPQSWCYCEELKGETE